MLNRNRKHWRKTLPGAHFECLPHMLGLGLVEIYPKTKHMMARILEKAKHCVALMESDVSWLHLP